MVFCISQTRACCIPSVRGIKMVEVPQLLLHHGYYDLVTGGQA